MLNPGFQKLNKTYIFSTIEEKLKQKNTDNLVNLGIGDVCLPLVPKIAEAICQATMEMTVKLQGYGPCNGFAFLREKICEEEYQAFGITPDEIFISDGASPQLATLHELFDANTIVQTFTPSYPVYKDTTLLANQILIETPLTEQNGFIPKPSLQKVDLIYLCTPHNPTGTALNYQELKEWVDFAKKVNALLIIDNVYNAFVSSQEIPSSIYAIEGGREVAIEIRSFSKMAGFTGLRCGYMVLPKTLQKANLHPLWKKRVEIKTNGVSYPIQKGALACYDIEGKKQLQSQIATYKQAASLLQNTLKQWGQTFFGGNNCPYIFWKIPSPYTSSWAFFDALLQANILAIPGVGFGESGEGFIRLSCFLSTERAKKGSDALHNYFRTTLPS